MAESFSREKIKARTAERRWMKKSCVTFLCVTPAGTSIDVQNEWEENTHRKHIGCEDKPQLIEVVNTYDLGYSKD